MKKRILVLGAGFGGLELSSMLSEQVGDKIDLTLIDKNDTFYFGFSKLDVMFGRKTEEAVKIPYKSILKPGVTFRQETITAIDPENRRVETSAGSYEADILVIALGAEYDLEATPGLVEGGNEFYSFEGAERLREVIPTFSKGHALIGVTSTPFRCPPAPSEAALMLHDQLVARNVREACAISIVAPLSTPVPPSVDTSKALLVAFRERGIRFIRDRKVTALDPARRVAILDDQSEMRYDLYLGVPKHRVPDVIAATDMTYDGWIPANPDDLSTEYEGVYAIGDVVDIGTPKAGMFAEGMGKTVAENIIADLLVTEAPDIYRGIGACYVEFGQNMVGRVDVEFMEGPATGTYMEASTELADEKDEWGHSRRARWFGLNSSKE